MARSIAAAASVSDAANWCKWGIINRFTNVLYDLTRRGLAVKIGHGPGTQWERSRLVIEAMLKKRRSLEQALVDLLATYQRAPDLQLARTIELIRAEIDLRKAA